MERDNIIKALECCITDSCFSCPYDNVGVYSQCMPILLENALTLIKELTEENKRLEEKADRHLDNLKAVLDERSENTIVADTVRKMQERLKGKSEIVYGDRAVCVEMIDEIAKEMKGE